MLFFHRYRVREGLAKAEHNVQLVRLLHRSATLWKKTTQLQRLRHRDDVAVSADFASWAASSV
jgi:hypothetical protein